MKMLFKVVFVLLLASMTAQAQEVYQDVETKVNYVLDAENHTAEVMKGHDEEEQATNFSEKGIVIVAGSPEVAGDLEIPAQLLVNGVEYTVTSIGDAAFFGCKALRSVTIPETVTGIGGDAFSTSSLRFVVSHIAEPFPTEAFLGSSQTATLFVPDAVEDKYKTTDGWKDFSRICKLSEYDEVIAQIYPSFVVEGRSWHYVEETYAGGGSNELLSSAKEVFYLEGDDVIDGKTWKKFYYQKEGQSEPKLIGAMREEGHKVYYYDYEPFYEEMMPVVLYDYDLTVGSLFPLQGDYSLWNWFSFGSNYHPLVAVQPVTLANGMQTTMYVFGYDGTSNAFYGFAWFEGLGSLTGYRPNEEDMLTGGRYGYREYFVSCNQGDEVLVTAEELNALYDEYVKERVGDAIAVPQIVQPSRSSALYDLSGRRLTAEPQKGVYIKDGRKYVK